MFIVAKSPSFGELYRAKTLNNDRNAPTVIYVDYGNEEEVPVNWNFLRFLSITLFLLPYSSPFSSFSLSLPFQPFLSSVHLPHYQAYYA